MIKSSQFSAVYSPGLAGKTLYDLYREIERDANLRQPERMRLLQQLQGVTMGAPASTPLSVLLARGLGGTVGYLISKYFGMGATGRAVSTALGLGLGKMVYDQFNKPKPAGLPGWKLL